LPGGLIASHDVIDRSRQRKPMNTILTLLLTLSVTPVTVLVDDNSKRAGAAEFSARVFAPWEPNPRPSKDGVYDAQFGVLWLKTQAGSEGEVSVLTRKSVIAELNAIRSQRKRTIDNRNKRDPEKRSRFEERKLPWEDELVVFLYLGTDRLGKLFVGTVSVERTSSRGMISGFAWIYGQDGEDQIEAFIRTVRSVNYQR
jgi:hypothetical protein